jgi:hypothetical protein
MQYVRRGVAEQEALGAVECLFDFGADPAPFFPLRCFTDIAVRRKWHLLIRIDSIRTIPWTARASTATVKSQTAQIVVVLDFRLPISVYVSPRVQKISEPDWMTHPEERRTFIEITAPFRVNPTHTACERTFSEIFATARVFLL